MPRPCFKAVHVIPEFHANSTTLGFTGGWTDEGLTGLCLARMRAAAEDEGVFLGYPMGWCEHLADIRRAQLARTFFSLELAPSSALKMQGAASFRIEFVLTDREFGQLSKALADIFRGLDSYSGPQPVRYDS